MKKVPILVSLVIASSLLAGCDTRTRYDVDDSSLPFANSLSEAISICKKDSEADLRQDRKWLSDYGLASYHSDKRAVRQVLSIPCDTNYVDNDSVSRKRGLDLGEICNISDNATMRVKKLIPDKESVSDPNWDKPFVERVVLSVVQYPCKNGNGCEKILAGNPVRWVVRDPSKCNLPASSLKPS